MRRLGLCLVLCLLLATLMGQGCRTTPKGEVCGGIRGLTCPEGQFCDLPAGQCRGADFQGVCVVQRQGCPRDFKPVCGCDGKTYPNECERIRAGVTKDHDGECGTSTPETPSGRERSKLSS